MSTAPGPRSPPLVPPSAPPTSLSERVFAACARRPFLALALVLLVQTVPGLWSRDLTYYDEVRHGNVLQHLLDDGHSFVLWLNGAPYPDKPPVYFWLLAGLSKAFGSEGASVFLLGAALSAVVYLFAVCAVAKRIGGASRETTLFAGALVLGSALFVAMARFSRMDLLFSAFVVLAQVSFHRGFSDGGAARSTVAGFAWTGLAALVKGPLGIAFPAVSTLLFLGWRGRLSRLLRLDVLVGVLVLLAMLGAWAAGVIATEGADYFSRVMRDQVLRRTADPWHHDQPFWFYAATLPILWLPWTTMLVAVPWRTLAASSWWRSLVARRKDADAGTTHLWCMVIGGFVLLSVVRSKLVIYPLPLLAPLGVLTARAFERVPASVARRGWTLIALPAFAIAVALPFANRFQPTPVAIAGLVPLAVVVAATGAAILLLRSSRRAPVVATTLGLTVGSWIASAALLPSIDPVTSPGATGRALAAAMDRGHREVLYKTYPGCFAYHAGRAVRETRSQKEVIDVVASNPKAVIVTAKKYWEGDGRKRSEPPLKDVLPKNLVVVHEQWILEQPYVVVATRE